MTSLNIDKYNENAENAMIWRDTVADDKQMAANNEVPKIEPLNQKPDLFDLARSISERANSRRRLRRSSSII